MLVNDCCGQVQMNRGVQQHLLLAYSVLCHITTYHSSTVTVVHRIEC